MILEGIVATINEHGEANIAPMGPIVEPDMQALLLRPFPTSQTFQNLLQRPYGVFHVVDDVLLLARAALDRLTPTPETFPAHAIPGRVLQDACRWYEFEVVSHDSTKKRPEIRARVVHAGRIRDFYGFNRAKHAVIEAAILASRLHILPRMEVLAQFALLEGPVRKTAGPQELEAFMFLRQYVIDQLYPPQQSTEAPLEEQTEPGGERGEGIAN
jgi:hypothetical protein